ncbi:MAG: hypothetical protein JOY71_09955 [Acetobacteraceae bacterium]|nr:hypothetical protein [Acetobacteraceae bacterium]
MSLKSAALATALLFPLSANAHDPNHTEFDTFLESLRTREGASCCNRTDCRVLKLTDGPRPQSAWIEQNPQTKQMEWAFIAGPEFPEGDGKKHYADPRTRRAYIKDHAGVLIPSGNETSGVVICWTPSNTWCVVPPEMQ